MKKRTLSLCLIFTILMTFTNMVNVQARALTAEEMARKFSELKAKYPTGWYWEDGWCNDYESGDCGTGYNNVAWECMGFAYKICSELFEEESRSTFYTHSNVNNLCVGDYVRRNGHSFVVTNISGETVHYVDCNGYNGYGYNVVCWERSMTKSQLSIGLEHIKTQYDNWVKTLDGVAEYVDLGTDFYAVILNKSCWKPLSIDDDGYIRLRDEIGKAYQTWKFFRQSDGSYKISSAQNGKSLDCSGGDANGEPLKVYDDWGGNNQRWFIYRQNDGYILRPKSSSTRVLDVTNGNLSVGTGIQLYKRNNTDAQIFAIYKGDDIKLKAQKISVSAGNSATNTHFEWTDAYGESIYNLRIIDKLSGEEVNSKWNLETNYTDVILPTGEYRAYVDTCNYFEYFKSNEVIFTIKDAIFNVVFDANGGVSATTNKNIIYNSAYGELPVPIRENYTFKGWFTSACGGIQITSDTIVTVTEDITLYAQWEKAEPYIDVTIKNSGNSKSIEAVLNNINSSCDVIVAGYKGGRLVTVDCVPYENQAITTLEGNMDEIKVMVWNGLSAMEPLCNAEVIPSSEWTTEQ